MQFDDFYQTVGVFGQYQKIKCFFVCLTYMLPPIMVYTWTFTAATPEFYCEKSAKNLQEVDTSDNLLLRYEPSEYDCRQHASQISTKECQRCYQTARDNNSASDNNNPLQPCTKFSFSRQHYQTTLVEEWSMVCNSVSHKSFVQASFFFGYMIGSLVFGALSDKYGRRPIMGASFCLICLASFICAFAPQKQFGFELSYSLFALGRFLVACATRGIALTGFVIGVEIVGPKQRVFAGIVIQYFFAIGELVLLVFALLIRTWRLLYTALAVLSVPFLFFYFILPESPRWLISKGHYDEAGKVLRHIAKANGRNFDAIAYEHLVNEEKKREILNSVKGHGLIHLLRSRIMCTIAIIMSVQWFVQNIVFYGVSQNTGSWSSNPYISFGASASVEIISYFIIHLALKRWGRKTIYIVFVMGFVTFTLLAVPAQKFTITGQKYVIFVVYLMLKFFASGSYAVIYVYANELFPTNARNTGIGICSMIARLGAIVGTLSNDMLTRIWLHFPIFVYGITSMIAVALVAICPETFNKPLPQTVADVEKMGLIYPCMKTKQMTDGQIDDNDYINTDVLLQDESKSGVV